MNAPSDVSMKNEDVLRVELEVMKRQHRDLDEAIAALAEKNTADQLTLQRLKKQKLPPPLNPHFLHCKRKKHMKC